MLAADGMGTRSVPFALEPCQMSRKHYEEAIYLQPLFNTVTARLVRQREILEAIAETAARPDPEFTGRLLSIWRKNEYSRGQPLLFNSRSDYFIDKNWDHIKQVELNTMSVSMAGHSARLSSLYGLYNKSVPENSAVYGFARAVQEAHQWYRDTYKPACSPHLLMIVKPDECNVFDQNALMDAAAVLCNTEYHRVGLDDESLCVDQNNIVRFHGKEVSVVYFRTAYDPTQMDNARWLVRERLELSRAIKCPDAGVQLAGMKLVQQWLTDPTVVGELGIDAPRIFDCFTGLYSMSPRASNHDQIMTMLRKSPSKFVLKPQREGGGHNVYGEDILRLLPTLKPHDLEGYILMDLIDAPTRSCRRVNTDGSVTQMDDAMSELGIYGTYFEAPTGDVLINAADGWLLRSKSKGVNEGGVMVGAGFLDGIALTD